MAQDKNSFLLYCDIITTIDKLSNEQAGKLFKHLLNYVNDNDPILDDLLLEIAFEPIKQSLKRDLIKYETRRKTAQENGQKGGRPKNPAKPSKTQKTQSVISKPRKAVSVSDSVSVSEDQKNIHGNSNEVSTQNRVPFKKIVEIYHKILPTLRKTEKLTEKRKGNIRQRWAEDLPALNNWENYFDYVSQSDFLMGRVESNSDRPPFRADLEWLINPSNFVKILEEKYHGIRQ